jgi:hypothetical protein
LNYAAAVCAGWCDDDADHDDDDAEATPIDEKLVADILTRQRAEREAARRLADEDRPRLVVPSLLTLSERVQQPRQETPYRIEGWQKAGQQVVMAAQF